MENTTKKIIAYLLIGMVLFFAILGLLSTWDIIDLERAFRKMMTSLVIIVCAGGGVVFISSMLLEDKKNSDNSFKD